MPVTAGVKSHLYVNGVAYEIPGDATPKWSLGGEANESINGATGRAGDKVTVEVPYIETPVLVSDDRSSDSLTGLRGAEVQLHLQSRIVTLTLASLIGKSEPDSDMKMTVRFEGSKAREALT